MRHRFNRANYLTLLILLAVIIVARILFISDSDTKFFSSVDGWEIKLYPPRELSRKSCMAIRRLDGVNISLRTRELPPVDNTEIWVHVIVLDVNTKQQQLRAGYVGTAKLFLNGRNIADGRLDGVGNWHNNERISSGVQMSFENIEPSVFRDSTTLEVTGDNPPFKPIKFEKLNLGAVVGELQRCLR
jgi:hypothetical protein